MQYIIKQKDDKGNVTYLSNGTTQWVTDKSKAETFDCQYKAKIRSLYITTSYELEVEEYEQWEIKSVQRAG